MDMLENKANILKQNMWKIFKKSLKEKHILHLIEEDPTALKHHVRGVSKNT